MKTIYMCRDPRMWLFVLFLTIAGSAAWDDVSLDSFSALADRINVVPRIGRVGAISTSALKFIRQPLLSNNRYWCNPTSSGARSPGAPHSVFSVCGKAESVLRINALSADASMNFVGCNPLVASAAPSDAKQPIHPALIKRGSGRHSIVAAQETNSVNAIIPRAISTKESGLLPCFAFVAPLESSGDS